MGINSSLNTSPYGETGIRRGLKILRLRSCGFESHWGHKPLNKGEIVDLKEMHNQVVSQISNLKEIEEEIISSYVNAKLAADGDPELIRYIESIFELSMLEFYETTARSELVLKKINYLIAMETKGE